MFADVGKMVGGRVLNAVLTVVSVLAIAGGGLWFWKHPEQLSAIGVVVRKLLLWLGVVLVLPWATFFVTAWAVKRDSNAAGAMLLIGLTAADVTAALALVNWHVQGTLAWLVLILGFLSAGVYNFVVCDFQAARFGERL
jgi:hypothetical protein